MRFPRFILFLFFSINILFSQQTFFTIDPCLDPEAETIYFSFEGDLWKVPVDGGEALRITAMDGEETRPSVSPDGKWLAFSGTQYGNKDIYIMPTMGGKIRQLTFHEAADDMDSWSWDSETIYFTSSRRNRYAGYSISIAGETPKRIFPHYFNTIHNVAEHPGTKALYFNESWESKNFAHRKRYKGDYNPDIKSYDQETGEYKEHTNYIGKDFGAVFDKSGNIYFMCDEANGEYNLYTFAGEDKTQLTDFESSIYWPKVSANGQKIVFRKDYQIHVYDVKTGETSSPEIRMNLNQTLTKDQKFNVKGNISFFDVSMDNKKIAFISRGRLFVSDIKGKFVKEIQLDPKEAVSEVFWLSDNETILINQSQNGYYNWFKMNLLDRNMKQISDSECTASELSMNSDRTKAVFLCGRDQINLMDLESFEIETIAYAELWAIYNNSPSFSPDDRYISFTAYNDFEKDIMIYDTEEKTLENLSKTRVSETNPFWSPDGKYLYFDSDPLNPSYPYGTKNARIFRVPLEKYEDPFKMSELDKLFEKDEEEEKKMEEESTESEDTEKEEEAKKADEKPQISINYDEIMMRMERISPNFGQQSAPYVIQKNGKTMILFLSDHDEGTTHLWKTTIEDFEDRKTEKISKNPVYGYQICEAENTHYILVSGKIHTLDISAGKLEDIDIFHSFSKNLKEEFEQMFYEAWVGMEENFYNETFHGQDWSALRNKYSSYLNGVSNRAQLRLLFNDMLGELNTSHFGFYSNGNEEEIYYGSETVETGIIFNNENPYEVERIVKDSPADVKDKNIRKGDILIEINGTKIDPIKNREYYFTFSDRPAEVSMTFLRGDEEIKSYFHTTNYFSIRNLIYDEWQDTNQEYVDSKTEKRIAYIHMKNMGGAELNRFKREIITESAYRDGLILDLRYNTGGNVHDDVLRLLSQKTYLNWKYREGKLTSQSNFGPSDKPIVLLINEQSLSDAEMTATGFKELGLGTIVGTETYRWIIFTSGKGLVDGSFYRLPSWGCYTLDGENIEMSGVSPDIRIEKDFKDRLDGLFPQLDKAIEIINASLNK